MENVTQDICKYQQNYKEIDNSIAQLMSPGVLSRSEMYQRIRQQGVLLSCQQDIAQRIIDLQNDAEIEKQKIEKYQNAIVECEKRQRNIARNLQRIRRDVLRRADINAENDIEEIVSYGDKNR
ncbi:MAG: hypothetical protein ACMZI0_17850 [Symbiopectobacterium sp.]|uniref:hypothetical protein n=1 Tax=Symbiopectobacterium sp. TaxID=2952789 RepID=UPI0039EA1337